MQTLDEWLSVRFRALMILIHQRKRDFDQVEVQLRGAEIEQIGLVELWDHVRLVDEQYGTLWDARLAAHQTIVAMNG